MLQDWGPKDSPNTIYEPESRLPHDFKQPAAKPAPTPQPKVAPVPQPAPADELELNEVEISAPTPEDQPEAQPKSVTPDAAVEPLPSKPTTKDAIGPYSEPLVGPMSSLPETAPEMKLAQDKLTDSGIHPGMPQTRVYEPLSHDDEPIDTVTIDATQMDAIAQSDPSS